MSQTIRRATVTTLLIGSLVLSNLGPSSVRAAPARMGVDGLDFSTDVDGQANPASSQIDFSSDTERVWASFAYRDYGGEAMTYLVRANGEDWRWGDLDCCEGSSGRFAFPIERRSGNDLGGAAYDVYVYASDAEVAHGGFGVRGARGFDRGDGNDNGD